MWSHDRLMTMAAAAIVNNFTDWGREQIHHDDTNRIKAEKSDKCRDRLRLILRR